MTMSAQRGEQGMELPFADRQDVADLDTFIARAKIADPGGAVRLQVVQDVLVTSVNVMPGAGLMGEGTVLGMRAQRLAREPDQPVDVVVDLAAVADRFARMRRSDDVVFAVPPAPRVEQWAALTPPRSGWQRVGVVAGDRITEIAKAGIVEVATGAPSGSGAAAVADLRRRVWGRPALAVNEPDGASRLTLPAGLAYAAHCLGIVTPGHEAHLSTHGRWTRLTGPGGYALSR